MSLCRGRVNCRINQYGIIRRVKLRSHKIKSTWRVFEIKRNFKTMPITITIILLDLQ